MCTVSSLSVCRARGPAQTRSSPPLFGWRVDGKRKKPREGGGGVLWEWGWWGWGWTGTGLWRICGCAHGKRWLVVYYYWSGLSSPHICLLAYIPLSHSPSFTLTLSPFTFTSHSFPFLSSFFFAPISQTSCPFTFPFTPIHPYEPGSRRKENWRYFTTARTQPRSMTTAAQARRDRRRRDEMRLRGIERIDN